jgi:hypothetical protein
LEPTFLDDLRWRLRRHGVSRRYVNRVVDELAEHFDLLVAEHLEHGSRDEEAAQLAQRQLAADPDALFDASCAAAPAASSDWPGGTLLSRILVLPLPLALVTALFCKYAGIFLYILVCRGFGVDYMSPSFVNVVSATFKTCAYGLTPLLALAFCCLAERSRRGVLLALASCLLLSVAGGMLKLDLVQCTASRHVAYFQRYGLDATRLSLPLIIFAAHTVRRLLIPSSFSHPVIGR